MSINGIGTVNCLAARYAAKKSEKNAVAAAAGFMERRAERAGQTEAEYSRKAAAAGIEKQ